MPALDNVYCYFRFFDNIAGSAEEMGLNFPLLQPIKQSLSYGAGTIIKGQLASLFS